MTDEIKTPDVAPAADAPAAASAASAPEAPAPEAPAATPVAPAAAPAPEAAKPAPSVESFIAVDVMFSDEQITKITEAGLEPAQVRNEVGLVKIKKEAPVVPEDSGITFTEALSRAVAKYKK